MSSRSILFFVLCLLFIIWDHRPKQKKQPKPKAYDKTIYKPRKRENKGLPDGNFTHEHVESMWDEIE